MALPNTTVWEVQPGTGADTNSGGFVAGSSGTDYSTLSSPSYSGTDLIIGASNSVTTTSSHSFGSADVGNIIFISAGSTFTVGRYEIVSVAAGAATLDRSPGTLAASGGTYVVGGCLATIGAAGTILATTNENTIGQTVWVKATATISTGVQITFSPNGTNSINTTQLIGYTTTRGDGGPVTISSTANSITCLLMNATALIIRNFTVNCNSKTSNTGIAVQGGGGVIVHNCLVENSTTTGFISLNNYATYSSCVATSCSGTAAFRTDDSNGPNFAIDCVAYSNSCTGFLCSSGTLIRCISANNTGASTYYGFSTGGSSFCILESCMAYGNQGDGIHITAIGGFTIRNCIIYGNTGYAINSPSTLINATSINNDYNAYGGNNSGGAQLNNVSGGTHDVTLTADPTVAGASNNFALNSTAGGGAACNAVGFPGILRIGGTGYQSIGPLQPNPSTSVTYVINKNQTIFQGVEQ